MSATLTYAPVQIRQPIHGSGIKSKFIVAMEETFGTFPITLTENNLETLKGMASVEGKDSYYSNLIQSIYEFGPIVVYADW